jgi:hypothetical protein
MRGSLAGRWRKIFGFKRVGMTLLLLSSGRMVFITLLSLLLKAENIIYKQWDYNQTKIEYYIEIFRS